MMIVSCDHMWPNISVSLVTMSRPALATQISDRFCLNHSDSDSPETEDQVTATAVHFKIPLFVQNQSLFILTQNIISRKMWDWSWKDRLKLFNQSEWFASHRIFLIIVIKCLMWLMLVTPDQCDLSWYNTLSQHCQQLRYWSSHDHGLVWSHNTALIADRTIKILKIIMLEQITAFCQSLCLCHQSFWYNLHSSPVITPVSSLHSWYTFTLHLRSILIAFIDQNKIFHWINRCCPALVTLDAWDNSYSGSQFTIWAEHSDAEIYVNMPNLWR